MKKNIIIVGAGPGGLAAGMILSSKGYTVKIFEKSDRVGGRTASFEIDGFKFDTGPTFLMLKKILDDVFKLSNENINEYLKFYELNPMYKLIFKNKELIMSSNYKEMRTEISKKFPGEEKGFDKFLKREKKRFDLAYPCLEKDYSSLFNLFNKNLIRFFPKISFTKSMYDELGEYFKDEDLKMSFTFQSKYLGMSAWDCPSVFMIIPYIEHKFGIQHVEGGLSKICEVMKDIIIKNGGKIYLNSSVEKITDNYIHLKENKKIKADRIIVNADIGYAKKNLFEKKEDFSKKKYSCSTFMIYLGLDIKLDLEFHSIFFSNDYKKYVHSIFDKSSLNYDISFYIRNASIIDKTIAPKNNSNIYILVPVPNNLSNIDWDKEKEYFRKNIFQKIKEKINIDIEEHILVERIITPKNWENDFNVFLGATFNLAHSLDQMLYFRPHNQLNKTTFLVGGGTNPGSGLPTIFESAKIASNLIFNEDKGSK